MGIYVRRSFASGCCAVIDLTCLPNCYRYLINVGTKHVILEKISWHFLPKLTSRKWVWASLGQGLTGFFSSRLYLMTIITRDFMNDSSTPKWKFSSGEKKTLTLSNSTCSNCQSNLGSGSFPDFFYFTSWTMLVAYNQDRRRRSGKESFPYSAIRAFCNHQKVRNDAKKVTITIFQPESWDIPNVILWTHLKNLSTLIMSDATNKISSTNWYWCEATVGWIQT